MSDGSNNNNDFQSAELSPERGEEELLLYCESESLSEGGLHEMIQRYGWTPKNTQNIICNEDNFFRAACRNERVTEGVIQCLLEYFPGAISATSETGWSSLHSACKNKNVTLGIIQAIVDAAPNSVRNVSNKGCTPLHILCRNSQMNEAAAIQILKLLIEKYPEAVRHANSKGFLPIHHASMGGSPEFCRLLIEAYPQSGHMASNQGTLPLHIACQYNTVATVEYLYEQYPEAIDHAETGGYYPISIAISYQKQRAAAAVEIVRFLLDCDPNQNLIKCDGKSLLEYTCGRVTCARHHDSNIDADIQIIKTIYDAHPEAIEDNIFSNLGVLMWFHRQVHDFVRGELVYARQAKDHRLMTTPDDNGQLPLHRALQNNVTLGSIKLLVKGNPSALRTLDYNFALPIHIACESHDSTEVIEYLLGIDRRTLQTADINNNTALHYASRGAKHDSIALLLEKYDVALVSKRNADGKIPIDLLWESDQVNDRESVEYMGSVFQLLKAYPEMLAISNWTEKQPNDADATRHGKKRKLCRADEV